jgi:hypothetical protein
MASGANHGSASVYRTMKASGAAYLGVWGEGGAKTRRFPTNTMTGWSLDYEHRQPGQKQAGQMRFGYATDPCYELIHASFNHPPLAGSLLPPASLD